MNRTSSFSNAAVACTFLLVVCSARSAVAQLAPSEITICGAAVPEKLQRANATFEVYYQIRTDESGRPSKITRLRADLLGAGEKAVTECLGKWTLPAANADVTVSMRWEHGKGWTRLSIAIPGEAVRRISIDPGWPF